MHQLQLDFWEVSEKEQLLIDKATLLGFQINYYRDTNIYLDKKLINKVSSLVIKNDKLTITGNIIRSSELYEVKYVQLNVFVRTAGRPLPIMTKFSIESFLSLPENVFVNMIENLSLQADQIHLWSKQISNCTMTMRNIIIQTFNESDM